MSKKSILINQILQLSGVEGIDLTMVEPCEDNYMLCHIYFDPDSVVDRLTPEEVALRNYNATVKRGLINDRTLFGNFLDKIKEETNELELEASCNNNFGRSELADISLVCDAMAIHYGIDLQLEKQNKMLFNEKRTD